MKCFHAHTPSHSPTPSHMPMTSVTIVTGNTNDTHIPILCQLTNTQCNLPMGNQSRVNPDSHHSTLGLSDKHDSVSSFWATELFNLHRGSLTPTKNFPDHIAGISHPYKTFQIIPRVSHTCKEFLSSRRMSLTPTQNFSIEGTNNLFLASPNTH